MDVGMEIAEISLHRQLFYIKFYKNPKLQFVNPSKVEIFISQTRIH